MRNFYCYCKNRVYFENTQCVACERELGFIPELLKVQAIKPAAGGLWRVLAPGTGLYRKCKNYEEHGVCNWMVAESDESAFCRSCRLDQVIPNLDEPKNRQLWYRLEQAKQRLLYTLMQLHLPIIGRDEDPQRGLGFQFLEDTLAVDEELGTYERVVTGHNHGLITINVAEADPSAREEIREQMNESYRTLLGHFRHESGHYYWDILVRNSTWLNSFREMFGDEREGYQVALGEYYEIGPPTHWQEAYITAYASCHPWEDWAETWAHYLHMVDTLETARDSDFFVPMQTYVMPVMGEEQTPTEFSSLYVDWLKLIHTMNSLNRSMGLPDAYPFVLSARVRDKLAFVHALAHSSPVLA